MYKFKNTLLGGALFASMLLCPSVGVNNGQDSGGSSPVTPNTTPNKPVVQPKQDSGVSTSGIHWGGSWGGGGRGYWGGGYGYYRPYYHYYPYRPYYYGYNYYPYRPYYYYNYYGW